uniref:EF-hand domain-containing protein n=1 Tax=uncultured Erythrobacter sp. TaxID=263913 RepID=UPI0026231288|nr:EF-hand domain-containing protein [uncultured Erythrobacter sp.]
MKISRIVAASALLVATPAISDEVEDDRAKARENFQQADADSNRKLTRAEFRNFIDANADDDIGRAAMVRRFGAYEKAFERLDANNDGEINAQELAAAGRK